MRGTLMGMEDVNGDGERLIDLYQSGFLFHFKWIDHSAFRVTYFPFQVYTMMKMMMSTCKILTIQIRWNGNFYCLHKRPSWEATGAAESSLINLVFSMCVAWWSRRRLWINVGMQQQFLSLWMIKINCGRSAIVYGGREQSLFCQQGRWWSAQPRLRSDHHQLGRLSFLDWTTINT